MNLSSKDTQQQQQNVNLTIKRFQLLERKRDQKLVCDDVNCTVSEQTPYHFNESTIQICFAKQLKTIFLLLLFNFRIFVR